LVAECEPDGIESLTPPPYADTELWEARAAWGGKVCIVGGISPHLLWERLEPDELDDYVLDLFARMAPGDNLILSVSDDTPTNARFDRLMRISELVERYGTIPLDPPARGGRRRGG
jgi:hypothetical protein